MMKVKTRKDHECQFCKRTIKKGSFADYHEGRSSKFGTGQNKTTLQYWKCWLCVNDSECKEYQ